MRHMVEEITCQYLNYCDFFIKTTFFLTFFSMYINYKWLQYKTNRYKLVRRRVTVYKIT